VLSAGVYQTAMRPFLLALFLAALALAQPAVGRRPFRIQELQSPAGFEVSVYAHLNGSPRLMTFGPNGVLYVAGSNSVWAVPAANQSVQILTRLSGAHAVQFKDQNDCGVRLGCEWHANAMEFAGHDE
jgi:hypothetical protein